MSAIVTALQSTTITRLGLTHDRLPRDAKRMLREMSDLLDPRHNHSAYRAILKDSSNQPCIPLFGKHEACFQHKLEPKSIIQPSTYMTCIPLIFMGKTW